MSVYDTPQERSNGIVPRVERTDAVGITHREIDVAATEERLDGERVLVRAAWSTDAEGQLLPATVHVHRPTLRERHQLVVDYGRYSNNGLVPVGAIERVPADDIELGVDREGCRHVWEPKSNVVRVYDADGTCIHTVDHDEQDGRDVRHWTQFVADSRGWARPDENGGDV